MPQNPQGSASHRNATPDVARPPLQIWQSLESERIRWEGQVLIVGQQSDLPALLVITGKRLALIANNEIALEFPLAWMRPEPKLVAENGIRLYISPDGDSQIAQPMLLRARSGKAATLEIAAVLTGRTIASRAADSPMHIPAWRGGVGAGPSVALPQLRDETPAATPNRKAAWPPVEAAGVGPAPKPAPKAAPRPSADIVPWRVGSPVDKPTPVPAGTSRAQRLLGTANDGFTVSDQPNRVESKNIAPMNERKHRMPLWLMNMAVVAMLLVGFGYVAVDRGYGVSDLQALVPGNVASYLGMDDPKEAGEIAEAPMGEPAAPTEEAIQQGGDNRLLPVKNTIPTPTPTLEPELTEEETVVALENENRDSIGGSSIKLPVTESVVVATPDATEEPTDVVTEEPTEVATEVPTDIPTEEATEEISTPEETQAPVDPTIDPTAVQPTETPVTPEPTVAPTQTVVLEQPASVDEGSVPNQEFVQGGIRYSINAVASGSSIPDLPEINNIGQTWVIVTLTGANTSSADQTFAMNSFTLLADGNAIPLDTGTAWVNSLLGNDPAYGNTDTATWAAGEQHQFTLTFLAPANASNLTLVAGDQQIALDPAITNSVGLREVATDAAPAATMTGTVVDVIDGQTIVVDVEGELITVRYLGIEAPTDGACYADEATLINAGLVEGQTVTLERQNVDTNARGIWVRDVWVTDADGNQALVSQALVSQGAASVKVSEPNSRYAGWLTSTEQEAQNAGTGIWSTCGDN